MSLRQLRLEAAGEPPDECAVGADRVQTLGRLTGIAEEVRTARR